MNSPSKRRYSSPLREEGARRTGELILAAAQDLFIAQGYVQTTIEQIAERAGVSRPTVFANAGSKRDLLKRLRDLALAGDDDPTPVIERKWYQEALTEPEPAASVRLHARNLSRIYQRYAQLDEIVHHAAATDPELGDFWKTAETQRRFGAQAFIESLTSKGPLRPGLDQDAAVDVLWVVGASEPYRRLVAESGWTPERYEQWLGDTLCDMLLPPAHKGREGRG
jgi:TetR/AcrR family transcriptional regulator, regulator of autoinduction and epiphytic fitness